MSQPGDQQPPDLDEKLPLEERVAALEAVAQGPPLLTDRLKRLEDRVGINRDDQDVVNEGVAAKLFQLFGITGALQSANVRLFGILVLVGSAIGSVVVSHFGLFQ